MGCFVIAEAGVNHNGSLERALRLVEIAARAGADAVKFQTFRADELVTATARKAEYQERTTGAGTQREMLRALELSERDHVALLDACGEHGIEFMSTAFDARSADFLVRLGIKRIKVPSGELTHQPFVEHLAGMGLPMLVSTGMADLDEVRESIGWIAAVRARHGLEPRSDITVLHCTSNYPAAPEDVNLAAMGTMARSLEIAVGYSDHTLGIAVATAAVALGAQVIEKHFTLDRTLPGPDHAASLEPDELTAMVAAIRTVERALGDGVKAPRPSELKVRDAARRSVTLAGARASGHVLAAEDLALLRPGSGIAPHEFAAVVGRRLARDLPAGSTLQWTDLA
jgi:N,N'-diacetyllegionaminate synthase